MGLVMQELNTCKDWQLVRHHPTLQDEIKALELIYGEAYVTKAERHEDVQEGMKVFSTPFPSNKPRVVKMTRAHVRVKPEKAFRRSQVPLNRYSAIELYNTGQKKTKGEGRAVYYARSIPGLFAEKTLVYVKETKEYLKSHGHKLPVGMSRVYKKRVKSHGVKHIETSSFRKMDKREFSIGEGDNQVTVTLHELETGRFRVLCDAMCPTGKEKVYISGQFLKSISCFKKWCEEARKAWIITQ